MECDFILLNVMENNFMNLKLKIPETGLDYCHVSQWLKTAFVLVIGFINYF
jgi:hypothetical protein